MLLLLRPIVADIAGSQTMTGESSAVPANAEAAVVVETFPRNKRMFEVPTAFQSSKA
jgi:hypothetical protein